MSSDKAMISLVVPVYNEVTSIRELRDRATATLEAMPYDFEIIMVDDGSSDGSLDLMKALRQEDPRLRVLQLSRNFGQSPALYAGFSQVKGDFVVMIDADLQNHPEDIPLLIEKLEEGADMVSGWRRNRKDSIFRRLSSKFLNWYISRATGLPLHDFGCALKAFRRELADHMGSFSHLCRYLPVDVASIEGNVVEVNVQHNARTQGDSKYSLFKLVRTAIDLLTAITAAPLQIIGMLGWLFAFVGFGMGIRVLIIRLINGNVLQTEAIFALLFFLGGMQLVATSLMCEYVSRIYTEVQRKPYYVIRREIE